MKRLLFLFIFSVVFGCDDVKKIKIIPARLMKDSLVNLQKDHFTKNYKNIDTSIAISLYNVASLETRVLPIQKRRLVTKALKATTRAYLSFDYDCWRYDNKAKDIYIDSISKAPECRINDFYLIDLDNDGDLDIIYSSLVDQYAQTDHNALLVFRNDNKTFKCFEIEGYLYRADFSKRDKGLITFKTVRRPCCEETNYNFFVTKFNTKNWNFNTQHILEINERTIVEQL